MPLYNYKCPVCQLVFEDLVPLAERDNPRPCTGRPGLPCNGSAHRVHNEVAANMNKNWAGWTLD